MYVHVCVDVCGCVCVGGGGHEQTRAGEFATHNLAKGDVDLRRDLPGYNVYRRGVLAASLTHIVDLWQAGGGALLAGSRG